MALTVQAAALANTKALRALIQSHKHEMAHDSVLELLRPMVAVAMVMPDQARSLPLNGAAAAVEYAGKTYSVTLQDVNGLVHPDLTPRALARALLPKQWAALAEAIAANTGSDPLTMRAGQAAASLEQISSLHQWLDLHGDGDRLSGDTLATGYSTTNLQPFSYAVQSEQTQVVVVAVGGFAETQ
ncbi:MAG: hypothetical protein AAF066_19655 [Pseudomonadota bacterium]